MESDNDSSMKESESYFVTSESLYSSTKSDIQFAGDLSDVSKFTRNLVQCVLDECMNELSILRSINLQNDLGTHPNKLISYLSIEDRYMGQENHAEFRINSTDSNFDKLARDVNMIYVILKEVCKEIKHYGKYDVMQETVEIINMMHKEEVQLLEDEKNQEIDIENQKNLLEEERLENIRTIEETDAKIQKLRFEVEDIFIYGQHEVNYFDKWEKARVEQNKMKCKEKENYYMSIIKSTEEKTRLEDRCHDELMAYLEESKNDDLDAIQYWMKRYDEEMEQREGDTIHLRADLDKITEERKLMTEKYNQRQSAIDDWLEYKRIKEEKEKQRLKEVMAATKIQAWWRGVMVRKKLGPYRRKKKGPGKGKHKDKGKKKKK